MLDGVTPVGGIQETASRAQVKQPLAKFLNVLEELLGEAERKATAFARGEPVDIHSLMIASEKALIGLTLALQIRNRALEAYQEIIHMQV
ncbi:flagellar hook-basal body complex protein FliE [Thermanaeromonas toyohensis ToBE]|uniref:Flagellar hook-basal body complex protein FliE n=1 Tax=Thermanaeromonas toyohensis ToBE TaxID=698762 RepID=A0A1W1VTX6_9FIRM|nr:flagellar hook-basal body complex protein FliE [Thermanaeromonas toyohensis]SMB96561.1 flagellar hook-basal body complex protein FliE [Thermanaeromonas toyohensis ToBE]